MHGGWLYTLSNRPNGTLYVGVTADLARRVWPHRQGVGSEFVRRYCLTRLVFAERQEIARAIQREKNIKDWPRAWKVRRLIHSMNPEWRDLYDDLNL